MWHSTLGVTPWASYEEVRAAFKRRVLETHPDKGGRTSEFREVMLAFEQASLASTEAEISKKANGSKGSKRRFQATSSRCKAEPKSRTKVTSKKKSGRNALIQRLHAYLRQLQRDDRNRVVEKAHFCFLLGSFCCFRWGVSNENG